MASLMDDIESDAQLLASGGTQQQPHLLVKKTKGNGVKKS
jgi:hypothetical protein